MRAAVVVFGVVAVENLKSFYNMGIKKDPSKLINGSLIILLLFFKSSYKPTQKTITFMMVSIHD